MTPEIADRLVNSCIKFYMSDGYDMCFDYLVDFAYTLEFPLATYEECQWWASCFIESNLDEIETYINDIREEQV